MLDERRVVGVPSNLAHNEVERRSPMMNSMIAVSTVARLRGIRFLGATALTTN